VKYVLDTNALSALMRGDAAVLDAMKRVERDAVLVPQPVLAEIAYGIQRLPRSRRKAWLRERLTFLLRDLARTPWTDEVSEHFGAVKADLERAGKRLEDLDLAIAAHALAMGATLVTANTRQMARVAGMQVEDWSRPTAQ
jgi:tRNA(fMet)-specific endonuclease VapC